MPRAAQCAARLKTSPKRPVPPFGTTKPVAAAFTVTDIDTVESPLCHAGEVLRGTLKPDECPAFGKECTPRTPLGATMVSAEGACAAYYLYGRFQELEATR